MGCGAPSKASPSDGELAPRLIGCDWIVPRQGASCFASSDGSISPAAVDPISCNTCGSLGCTGVLVMRCQKQVRSSTAPRSAAQGAAAV